MRTLREIAGEIRKDWSPVHQFARPYVEAMLQLNSVNDRYVAETGADVVRYFLVNATTWRGETARRVKAELNKILKEG